MNSYFDHSSVFYPPSAAAAEVSHHHRWADQAAYRSFSQSLSLVPPSSQTPYQSSFSRSNPSSSSPSDSSNNYEAACKLYETNGGTSGSQASAFKAECGLSKDQNGFKPPDQMAASSWNTSSLRPSSSSVSMSGVTPGFESAARSADSWSSVAGVYGHHHPHPVHHPVSSCSQGSSSNGECSIKQVNKQRPVSWIFCSSFCCFNDAVENDDCCCCFDRSNLPISLWFSFDAHKCHHHQSV